MIDMENVLKWRYYSLLGIVVLLPFFPKFLTPLIILNFILWIFEQIKLKEGWKFSKNPVFIFMCLFYVWHLVGLLWTSNFKYAGLDLQIKLPLLLIPLTFLTVDHKFFEIKEKILNSFVCSLVLAVVFCFFRASYFYF